MLDIPYFIFVIAVSVLFCIPGILLNMWLCKIGVSRETKKSTMIITAFFFVFLKPFFYEYVEWWIYGMFLTVVIAISVHYSDLVQTIKHGKWWWKAEEKEKEQRSSI